MAAEPFFMALMKVQIVEKDLRADALVSWMRSMTATPKGKVITLVMPGTAMAGKAVTITCPTAW